MNLRPASFSNLRRGKAGFTLVEMMAAVAVLMVLLVIIAMATSGARSTITRSQATVGAFSAARTAFENMTDKLSQATLNTYWDYYGQNSGSSYLESRAVFMNATAGTVNFVPLRFGRCSDLQFRIMQNSQEKYYGQEIYFQTPAAYSALPNYQSTQGLMNACGYFVEYCSDSSFRPTGTNILPGTTNDRWRYRLMQGLEPSENLAIYNYTSASNSNGNGGSGGITAGSPAVATTYAPWQANIQNTGGTTSGSSLPSSVVPVADNVICVVFWPRVPLQNDAAGTGVELLGSYGTPTTYLYDSQVNIMDMFSGGATQQKVWDEQLPPIVEVTMIVIDEASAARIATNTSTPPTVIESALAANGTAAYSTVVTGANNTLTTDLTDTEAALNKAHINFRVLSSYVVMRESKWSTSASGL